MKSRKREIIKQEIIDRYIQRKVKMPAEWHEWDRFITERAEAILKLRRINGRLQSLNEAYCDPLDIGTRVIKIDPETNWDKFEKAWKKAIDRAEKKAYKIAEQVGFKTRIQHDPRGSAIKLDIAGEDSVNFIGNDTDLLFI